MRKFTNTKSRLVASWVLVSGTRRINAAALVMRSRGERDYMLNIQIMFYSPNVLELNKSVNMLKIITLCF